MYMDIKPYIGRKVCIAVRNLEEAELFRQVVEEIRPGYGDLVIDLWSCYKEEYMFDFALYRSAVQMYFANSDWYKSNGYTVVRALDLVHDDIIESDKNIDILF